MLDVTFFRKLEQWIALGSIERLAEREREINAMGHYLTKNCKSL
jgi:hypothetical protein